MPSPRRTIRPASLPHEGEAIMNVFAAAKAIMRSAGNPAQWSEEYPTLEVVGEDARCGGAFVVEDDERIVAYFALLPSPEPTYAHIEGGAWVDDMRPYHVLHRIASTPESCGIFSSIVSFAFSQTDNLRIDTHRDNRIMQHLLQKHGFRYCGIIFLASGDERLAYQKLL